MNHLAILEPWLAALQVIASVAVIVLVLLQRGKGADMGAAFGSGSAGSLFGAAGAANFFSRMTKWAAVVFFICTLGLAYISSQVNHLSRNTNTPAQNTGVMEGFKAPTPKPVTAPVNNAVPTIAPSANNTGVPAVAPTAKKESAPAPTGK